jgi:hypothetical protein
MAHNLYRKDNKEHTFVIDNSMMHVGKIKMTLYKRGEKNKRIDMCEFYENYQSFIALLKVFESKWIRGEEFRLQRFGGTDGERRITWDIKKGKLQFWFEDNIIKEKYDDYSGKLMFPISTPLDHVELFDLQRTLNNWELKHLDELWADDDTKKTDSA